LLIKVESDHSRLDKFLLKHFEFVPISLLQKLIRKYKIKINNKKSKSNTPLVKGDIIYIYYNLTSESPNFDSLKINENQKKILLNNIIFQNDYFIIINKLAGYASQRGSKVKTSIKDLYESLLNIKLYIVHRLDKDTSGLMVLAKNRMVASDFSDLFINKKIFKYYIAITNKHFEKNSSSLINVNNEKKTLKLRYRKINSLNSLPTYFIQLLTGKKHQIRLQFYLNNNPIVGDKKFTDKMNEKLHLISTSLKFNYLGKFYKFNIPLSKINF
jgi:23S rRNA pseudouridine955/2504/2580 synthase